MRQSTVCLALLASIGIVASGQNPPAAAPSADDSRTILDKALHDKNPDTRKEAVIALSLAGAGEPADSWLASMLEDKDVEVRVATVATLADLKSTKSIEALHKALQDEVPEVSFAAAKALFTLNDPAGKEALLSVIDNDTKTKSGYFTRQKRDALRLLHTPKPMFVLMLKSGVGMVPVPGVGAGAASLIGLVTDPSISGRAAAALLLGREKDAPTLAALKDALTDKDWSVRASAVHSLALRNDPALLQDVDPLMTDKKQQVQFRAAAAHLRLETLGHKKPMRKKSTSAPPSASKTAQ